MGNKNKNKGKRGESEVCKILTEIFELPFMRVLVQDLFLVVKIQSDLIILHQTSKI